MRSNGRKRKTKNVTKPQFLLKHIKIPWLIFNANHVYQQRWKKANRLSLLNSRKDLGEPGMNPFYSCAHVQSAFSSSIQSNPYLIFDIALTRSIVRCYAVPSYHYHYCLALNCRANSTSCYSSQSNTLTKKNENPELTGSEITQARKEKIALIANIRKTI